MTQEVTVHGQTVNGEVSAEIDAMQSAVLSFSYDGAKASIKFAVRTATGATLNLSIDDTDIAPHSALVYTMELLAEDLAGECEVEDTESNPVIFTKFSSTTKKGKTGYKLVGKRELKGARTPMSIVSPLKWDDHADDLQLLDPATVERLEVLKEEVRLYLSDLLQPAVVPTLFGSEQRTRVSVRAVVSGGDELEDETDEPEKDSKPDSPF